MRGSPTPREVFELPERYFVDERARAQRILSEMKQLFIQQEELHVRLELVDNRLDCIQLTLWDLRNTTLFEPAGMVCLEPPPAANALRLLVQFPAQYPLIPPLFDFLQVPFHPNVRPTGELCYNLLHNDYQPDFCLPGLVTGLRVLLEEPNVDDFVNAEAAAYYRRIREAEARLAAQ